MRSRKRVGGRRGARCGCDQYPRRKRRARKAADGIAGSACKLKSRLLVSLFYSNPEKLEVHMDNQIVKPLELYMPASNSYNFSMRKPALADPCCSNAYAAWENKLYVTVCGGIDEAVTIHKSTWVNMMYSREFLVEGHGAMPPKTRAKIVCVGPEQRVVGLHMIGLAVDEMLQGFGVAIKMGASKEQARLWKAQRNGSRVTVFTLEMLDAIAAEMESEPRLL